MQTFRPLREFVLLAIVCISLVGCSFQKLDHRATSNEENGQLIDSPSPKTETTPTPTKTNAFHRPILVCDALKEEGLPSLPNTKWKNVEGSGYACVSDYLEVTPGGYEFPGDVPNVIVYYVESEREDLVQKIKLSGRLFNERKTAPVKNKLIALTKALFANLDLKMPDEILAKIDQSVPAKWEMGYGTVKLIKESNRFGYSLIVELEPK